MPPRPRARRYDAAALSAAAGAQWQVLVNSAAGLSAAELTAPAGLGNWTVGALLAHVAAGVRATSRSLARPGPGGPGMSLADYVAAAIAVAPAIAARGQELAAGRPASELAATLRTEAAAAAVALDDALARYPGQLVVARLGTLSLSDWLLTRLVEAVVHSLDLDRALGRPIALLPAALRPVTQALAEVLAAQAPGPAVEVRIPPYAAVQCIAGPRHTRGTPPNVVEFASPSAWLLVATGRTSWSVAVAAGEIRASGERADLSTHLPVLR